MIHSETHDHAEPHKNPHLKSNQSPLTDRHSMLKQQKFTETLHKTLRYIDNVPRKVIRTEVMIALSTEGILNSTRDREMMKMVDTITDAIMGDAEQKEKALLVAKRFNRRPHA